MLSERQVLRLEVRRQALGLTRAALLRRFEDALKRDGCVHTEEAAKMRLDRVFNPRMRRPLSENTSFALSAALGWTVVDFQRAIDASSREAYQESVNAANISVNQIARISSDLAAMVDRLHEITRILNNS